MSYRLAADGLVIRLADGAVIPPDPRNADRMRFDAWVSEGNTPAPAPAPAPAPPPLDPIAIINAHVESVARGMDYSSAASCAGYAASTVPQWAAEAQAFIAWRDQVWTVVFAWQGEPVPETAEEIIALLPEWVRPGS